LLAAGANINARDIFGVTALHWAAQRGDEKSALLLLSHRPEVNVQDEFWETPRIWAATVGDRAIVEALLAAGANPNLTDVSGLNATAWA
jgi:ankyrin repeat protein